MEKSSQKYLVLAYVDNALGRDTEILLPVAFCLENYFECEVQFTFIWDLYAVKRKKPDLVLVPNMVGHHMYVEVGKYAYENGITVLALESEGNFKCNDSFNYWGYNTDRHFYQEWATAWSYRTEQYLKNIAPEQSKKIVTTGGTGFDKYQFGDSVTKQSILSKYGLEDYRKVIGYAGWAFGKMHGKNKYQSMKLIHPDWSERFKWAEENRIAVREVLRKAIVNNEDTLFILKRHPKEFFEDEIQEGPNEMNELLGYKNVLYLVSEEPIDHLIQISDIWLGFETTTALEAWLLGKETVLVNPDPHFTRDALYKGSLIVRDYEQLQEAIDTFYQNGKIEDFHTPELKESRKKLISETIGFSDGFNHLRACYYFVRALSKRRNHPLPWNLRHLRLYFLMHIGKYFYNERIFKKLPGFKKSIYVFKNLNLPGLQSRKAEIYKQLDLFYKQEGLCEKIIARDWASIFGGEWPRSSPH